MKEEKKEKKITQSDLLATPRIAVVGEDSDYENAENGSLGWMSHVLKFVKHFEVGFSFRGYA